MGCCYNIKDINKGEIKNIKNRKIYVIDYDDNDNKIGKIQNCQNCKEKKKAIILGNDRYDRYEKSYLCIDCYEEEIIHYLNEKKDNEIDEDEEEDDDDDDDDIYLLEIYHDFEHSDTKNENNLCNEYGCVKLGNYQGEDDMGWEREYFCLEHFLDILMEDNVILNNEIKRLND